MVSGKEIWLGLGATLRVAGMGGDCGFCGFAWHGGRAFTSRQAFRSLDFSGYSPGGCHDYYLPREGRETTLALGKGLAFAHDCALKQFAGAKACHGSVDITKGFKSGLVYPGAAGVFKHVVLSVKPEHLR